MTPPKIALTGCGTTFSGSLKPIEVLHNHQGQRRPATVGRLPVPRRFPYAVAWVLVFQPPSPLARLIIALDLSVCQALFSHKQEEEEFTTEVHGGRERGREEEPRTEARRTRGKRERRNSPRTTRTEENHEGKRLL